MALVSQEPVLFKGTIFDNIYYGLVGKMANSSISQSNIARETRQLVQEAAKTANAHDFILSLPQGYDTDVGEMGGQLSGGQRQRIAIARAIVGNPRILLLDEATAAMDTKSERHVLNALKRASVGRTTIFITHRLSSIRDADQIVIMSEGQVIEAGTHESLAEHAAGVYAAMLDNQRLLTSKGIVGIVDDTASRVPSSITSEFYTDGYAEKEEPGLCSEVEESSGVRRATEPTSGISSPSETENSSPKDQYSLWSLVKMAFSLNKPELQWVVVGLVCCLLSGALNPVLVYPH